MTSTADSGRARGWYYGWNIVAICMVLQIAGNGLPINSFSLFLRDWSNELHMPISTLQLGMAAIGVTSSLFAPFVGIFADKYPARWLFGAGLAGIAIVCLGVSFMTELWHFLLLYGLILPISLGLSSGIPANALIARWFVRRLGLALALSFFGLGMAGVIMPPIIAAIMPDLGWRAIWLTGGLVIALVVLPLVLLLVRERPRERDGLHYLAGEAGSAQNAGGDDALSWRQILARRNFWLILAVFLSLIALWGGLGQNLVPIATSRGLSQQSAAVLLSLFNLAYLGGTLLAGILSDRFGNRLPFFGLALGAAIGGLICAIGQDAVTLGVGVMLVGMGGGFWPLLSAAMAVEFGANGFGRAFGLAVFFMPAVVFAPFGVAKVQEITGSYVPALVGLAAATLLGGAAILFLRERRQGQPAGAEPAPVPAG